MDNPYVKTLEPVWRNLDYIFINEQKLEELIQKMSQKNLETPSWTVPDIQPPIDCKPAEWIDFVCWINTVNFAFSNFQPPFNKFSVEFPEGVLWSGAFALDASFIRAQKDGIPIFDAEYMSKVSLKDVKHIFRPIDEFHQLPLVRERWKIFHEVGRILLKKYDGDWFNLFNESGWRAFNNGQGIVEQLVASFPSFRDERVYRGCSLKFHKRAQLLAMVYYGRSANSINMPRLKDIDNIGPIADYDVPKALKFLGVLEYAQHFEKAICDRVVIQPGDPREVENRLAMSYIMKRICDEVKINMAQADYYIWEIGRKSKEPHILVPTINY